MGTATKKREPGPRVEVAVLKAAAAGRELEILVNVAGVPADYLDGKPRPCPKCGGKDRCRMIDGKTGAMFCNQCFNHDNGDFLAAVQWMRGLDFPGAVQAVADYLGLEPNRNGHAGNGRPRPASKAGQGKVPSAPSPNGHTAQQPAAADVGVDGLVDELVRGDEGQGADGDNHDQADQEEKAPQLDKVIFMPLPDLPLHQKPIHYWCRQKPPVTREAVAALGGRYCIFPRNAPIEAQRKCLAFDGRDPDGTLAAVLLVRADGEKFPEYKKHTAHKVHLVKGSRPGWLWPGDVEAMKKAKVLVRVEGLTDLAALVSVGLPPGWLPVSSSHGAEGGARKLDYSIGQGKKVVVFGDADESGVGQEGKRRAAAGFHAAGAAEVRVAKLPYEDSPEPGKKDVRDFFLDHSAADFLALVEAAEVVDNEQAEEWAKAAKRIAVPEVVNYKECIDKDGNPAVEPMNMQEIIEHAAGLTGDWPRRIDTVLFVDDAKHGIGWLEKPQNLFGYLHRQVGAVTWYGGKSFVKQSEFFAELQRTARRYTAVASLPHEPEIEGYYYACLPIAPGDGEALRWLLDRFSPETPIDRDLIQAAMMTALWGGPPGCRPAFVVTSDDGRGVGKTTVAKFIGEIFGGVLSFSHNEQIGDIKTRLLSPEALPRRVCLLDNVKSLRFSWAELEAMITTPTIGGHRMYVGEAQRPNTLIWFITLNGAALSTDMAQRSVVIKIKRPERSAGWEEETRLFVRDNAQAILGDLVAALRTPQWALPKFSRWATWEREILQRLPEPSDAQTVILERQESVDVEGEDAELVEDFFAEQLRKLKYDPEQDRVHLPSQVAARWFGWATNQTQQSVTGVSRVLKQLCDEGRLRRLAVNKCLAWGRGFIWHGDRVDVATHVFVDLEDRLREQKHNP